MSKESFSQDLIHSCYDRLNKLRLAARKLEEERQEQIETVPESYRSSAINFIHYLAIRQEDIRQLQIDLSQLGLSSLGRMESHVMIALQTVMRVLASLSDGALTLPEDFVESTISFREGDRKLQEHAMELLGKQSGDRAVRIMVTFPSHAATDKELVLKLMEQGMEVARINSAHDDEAAWTKMISNIREAEEMIGRKCKVLMDLSGPKIRTGPLKPGPRIIRINPKRDARGYIREPEILELVPNGVVEPHLLPVNHVPVDAELLHLLKPGDEIKFIDVPGRKRKWNVLDTHHGRATVSAGKSFFIETGTRLQLTRNGSKLVVGNVGEIRKIEDPLVLQTGDILELTADGLPGSNAIKDNQGLITRQAHISCTLPEVFDDINVGHRVFFDDGKIGSVVREKYPDKLVLEVTRAAIGGVKLRSDKGINFPDSDLTVPPITSRDKEVLEFAIGKVDMIGMSFVRNPASVIELENLIEQKTKDLSKSASLIPHPSSHFPGPPSLVLKIENREAFERLPALLLAGMRTPPVGVMVARGDLGVEVGFERMAEVQEQILWLCEAAHVPVIWATQVLEQMNKKGLPSRGEVTDAAMSSRAECVMLNKGDYLPETVQFLQDVLLRMQDHHQKKTSMLRRLKVSEGRWVNN